MIGTRLGPYEITAKLGEGGMGEVYRATDTKLHRDVAIKVLPAAFTEDDERLQRFEREAQLLAQLHHPNIASIFGLEESDGTRALVMELVEGPTLADRLEQGPLPIEESLSVARQIAEALEEAHEKGIVHRDLKPQNIKASVEGKVKVLDFGLAKAMDPDGAASRAPSGSQLAASPTLTLGATVQGVVLGTAAYMSPEQAKGLPVDARADVWAFGVVLYEMLVGGTLFAGDTVGDTLAAVIRKDVDLENLPASVPPALRRLLRRCLERNPKNRLHSIADARIVIEDVLTEGAGDEPGGATEAAASGRAGRLGWAIAGMLALAVAWLAPRAFAPAPRPPLLRFQISSASGASISPGAGSSAISPDGRRIVFVGTDAEGRTGLWLQELDQIHARLLTETGGAQYPFWAPDSRQVAFFASGELRKVALDDGRIETICGDVEGRGGSWGRRGEIVFAPSVTAPIVVVPAGGGTPRPVTELDASKGEVSHRFPAFLPDGRRFVYLADRATDGDLGEVYLASVDDSSRKFLFETSRAPIYAPPGYLIHAPADRLVAQQFDPDSGELLGPPRRLEEATPPYVNNQDRVASVSDGGALMLPNALSGSTRIAWLDRRGRLVGEVPLPDGRFQAPQLSPDERRLALHSVGPRTTESDVWVVDLETERADRLTFEPGHDREPIWSPDGGSLLFQSDRSGARDLWVRPASPGGVERPLYVSSSWNAAREWSREFVAFASVEQETGYDIFLLRADRPDEPPIRLLSTTATELEPAISPDGRWLAYSSGESGRLEVYVVSLPDAATRYQVTSTGGRHPVWSTDGGELYYLTLARQLVSVPVRSGETLRFGAPEPLFGDVRPPWGSSPDLWVFDVTSDGNRFVVLRPKGEGSESLTVVTDWLAELEKGSPGT